MKQIVILENIRSAYNVGNIIRTADALGFHVILAGFTPSPTENERVQKTSLDAEHTVNLQEFWHIQEALDSVKKQGYILIAAEVVAGQSMDISMFSEKNTHKDIAESPIALVLGKEKTGVMQATLEQAKYIVHIPMEGIKESLNVGQAAAIMMRELKKLAR